MRQCWPAWREDQRFMYEYLKREIVGGFKQIEGKDSVYDYSGFIFQL